MEKSRWYEFSHFRLDTEKRLLFRNQEIVSMSPKVYEVLLVLIEHHGQLIKYEQLKKLAWSESQFVEDSTLKQTIYTLRMALGDNSKEQKYIENIPKRGYRFVAEIVSPEPEADEFTIIAEATVDSSSPPAQVKSFDPRKHAIFIIAPIFCIFAFGIYRLSVPSHPPAPPIFSRNIERDEIRSPSDETAIKQLLEESQNFESLRMYVEPHSFNEEHFSAFWLSEQLGGKEILKVRDSLKRLQTKGLRYGQESRVERFEFRYIRVFSPRDYAEAGTVEKWFLPMYRSDNSRVEGRNEYLGPYQVDYALRKIDGRWLIEETSTPRYEDK